MNIAGFQRKPANMKYCMFVLLWQVMIKADDLHFLLFGL
jgi:hypothetical protein